MISFLDEVVLPGDVVDVAVAACYVGVFGGGSGRVSEGEGEGLFLRNLSKDLSFCVTSLLEEMGLKVNGDRNGGVAGF